LRKGKKKGNPKGKVPLKDLVTVMNAQRRWMDQKGIGEPIKMIEGLRGLRETNGTGGSRQSEMPKVGGIEGGTGNRV